MTRTCGTFDGDFKLVTSYLFSPFWLASLRLLIALFIFSSLVFNLVWVTLKTDDIKSFLSYFTNLTFIGLCAYFFVSAVQTFCYSSNIERSHHRYPLQNWPRLLQYHHSLLLVTVVTFPLLVTAVYWILLASAETFETPFSSFTNVTKHALNSLFASFEIMFTNIGPPLWVHLPVTIMLLFGYLGVAYITFATQGFYTYSFLNPKKQGIFVLAYIAGIAVGQMLIFLLVFGIVHLRQRLTSKRTDTKETYNPNVEGHNP